MTHCPDTLSVPMPRVAQAWSFVHSATFSAGSPRLVADQQVVEQKLPRGTRFMEVDGVSGWLYAFGTELGDRYHMFVYHDGSGYQVKVVFPEVEGKYDPHRGHLFPDGLICWGQPMRVGLPTLEQAWSKSVLWANGFSVFLRTGTFPFSINNLGR